MNAKQRRGLQRARNFIARVRFGLKDEHGHYAWRRFSLREMQIIEDTEKELDRFQRALESRLMRAFIPNKPLSSSDITKMKEQLVAALEEAYGPGMVEVEQDSTDHTKMNITITQPDLLPGIVKTWTI
jgi:hypothetical protein